LCYLEFVRTFVVVDTRFCLLLVGVHISTGWFVILSTRDSCADPSSILHLNLTLSLLLKSFQLVEGLQIGFQALRTWTIRISDVGKRSI